MNEQIEKKSYYAIIPANVRYDRQLTPNAKLLYGEITALCNERGYCWSNNEYFANLYEVSKTSISKWIASLIDGGYIQSRLLYKEGTKEILNRHISLVAYPMQEKLNRPIEVLLTTPIEENFKDNSTVSNNTTVNNTVNNTTKLYDDFLFILNLVLKKNYKGCNKSRKAFPVRLKEGFKLNDFKIAISNASLDGFHIDNGFKYLTPEFLTRSDKLDRYMQTTIIPTSEIQKTNFDHFTSMADQINQRINSIPDDVYNQFKEQFTSGL